jgi:signal transduction histidine kinase
MADGAIPVVVGLFLASLVESTEGLSPALKISGILAGLVQGGALWWRRSHPEVVMTVALVGGAVVQLLNPDAVFPYAGLIALASLTARRRLRVSLPALAALLGVTSLDYVTATTDDATFAMLVAVVPWALGEAMRNRGVAVAEESRRAVSEEQARIARELHDVLAHSVSVIVVQAAAADDVFDEHPDQARTALRSIETVARDALGELKRVLTAVRPATEGQTHQASGLDRLEELAGSLRAAGLEVELRRTGASPAGSVPSGVDLSAYRIVQEALTNTLRHAQASRVVVTVREAADMLELEIRDNGRGGALTEPAAGRGIAGMRERATLLGGTLEAGGRPEGGFRVFARLPVEAAR